MSDSISDKDWVIIRQARNLLSQVELAMLTGEDEGDFGHDCSLMATNLTDLLCRFNKDN